jgi:phytoene synthase
MMTAARPDIAEWTFPNRSTPVGSAAYYAVRFSPEPLRQRNALLFAWYELIQAVAERPHDPGAARLKLDWWRQEIANIACGKARHPLAIQLQQVGLNEQALPGMIAVVDRADAEIRSPSLVDWDAFATACRESLGNVFLLLGQLEYESRHDADYCVELGTYCAAVERIRQLPRAPQRVPQDLSLRVLEKLTPAQRAERIDRVLDRFGTSDGSGTGSAPDFARRLTALTRAMHSKMRRRGYPITGALIDRAPIAHLWTAWRCR